MQAQSCVPSCLWTTEYEWLEVLLRGKRGTSFMLGGWVGELGFGV